MPGRTRQGIPEFTKENVIEYLKTLEVPTVTNKDYGADWWNTNFGQVVKHSFSSTLKVAIENIEKMWQIE